MTTTIFVIFVLLSIECGSSFLSCRASNGLLSNSPLYSSMEAGSERTFANYVIYICYDHFLRSVFVVTIFFLPYSSLTEV